MKKKISIEKKQELDFLKEWSFTLAHYFIEIGISNYQFFLEAGEQGYKENCLKCFQESITDINIDYMLNGYYYAYSNNKNRGFAHSIYVNEISIHGGDCVNT